MRDGDKPLQMYPSQVPDHQGVDQVDNEASHLSHSEASSPVPDSEPALLGHKHTDSARHPNLPSRNIYYLWLSYIYGIKRDVHFIP